MEESNLQPDALVFIFGSESVVLDVLNHKSQLTEHQTQALASFFQLSPDSFA
jgi:antitoxin component HigA of HigAB toxin-antitoxin module